MKILALDLGDAWVGTALSDALGMFARPYETVATADIEKFLTELLVKEPITTIVVGYPKTMRGTESEQTKKVIEFAKQLEHKFPTVTWKLWDERLSSKRAGELKKTKNAADKKKSHSVAAAFILSSYLEFLSLQ
jgi:putative Holliday junction resolvase